ncbi:MAG: tRNA (adenosine(37)-N6)-threonylcarbamoyltransferase complex ATPase subunit type 1 TsaE, partial [Aestuariibacter sp.]|nr:tRNA (adenosine(37)-N6)-threonylcarbamoyltransferase complex ATPase subunit type 1 TsaE [Aestuariibacter sp.]
MRAFGAKVISACSSGGIITLHGNLGTGKTTLVRGAL